MTKTKRHIALFLWGAYFLPLLFQQVHVIWHHSCHHCEHHMGCRVPSEHNDQEEKVSTSDGTGVCPICNYKFTISNDPDDNIITGFSLFHGNHFREPVIARIYKSPQFVRSPRAPPAPLFS